MVYSIRALSSPQLEICVVGDLQADAGLFILEAFIQISSSSRQQLAKSNAAFSFLLIFLIVFCFLPALCCPN